MCLSKTASVSACVLDVGVGKPSVGQGRGPMTADVVNVEVEARSRPARSLVMRCNDENNKE